MNPIFIGHGSPMNAIADNRYTQFLKQYAASIGKPSCCIVISAHWQTAGTFITGSAHPQQIYDFYGFPEALYQIRYRPAGSEQIAALVAGSVPGIQIDGSRGIDHAGWAVVKHMYPEADIPLLELSLDVKKSPQEHFALGQQLASLIPEGILFIGSGNLIHNLQEFGYDDIPAYPWAVSIDTWLKQKTEQQDTDALIHYKSQMPDYGRALPTDEHYLPLLYVLGMGTCKTLYEEIQNGCISMRSLEIC